jgi:hypothetical protein
MAYGLYTLPTILVPQMWCEIIVMGDGGAG